MISAALIVRNEATEIVACLDTLLGLDEIVVVDTGSVDETRDLVAQWADRHPDVRVALGDFPWGDDFAAARNHAASLCTGDWIIHIDADMRLEAGGAVQLRSVCAQAKGDTLALIQESLVGRWRNRRVLCHRRGAARWAGAIHEALDTDDGDTAQIIVHYGWSDSHRRDPDRNLRILHAEVRRHRTPRLCYYLGQELFTRGRLDEAAAWFTRCTELSTWPPESADAWLYLAKIHWRQHEGPKARLACLQSIGRAPDCREALHQMAEMTHAPEADAWRRYAATATDTGVLFVRPANPDA